MPQTETIAPIELIVNRTFKASRERVFRAWTDPKEMDRWFAPDPNSTIKASVDLRVGGAYRIEITNGERVFGAHGVYREIRRPSRLVFTWDAINCGVTAAKDTLVTVELFEVGEKTQVTLTHQNFADTEARERHEQGWKGCLDRLEVWLKETV
jgi:uncharacterized protein YndB with AHSA1/START domain